MDLLAGFVDVNSTLTGQAAALRDEKLRGLVADNGAETSVQIASLSTRMKQAAPQALVVAS